MDLITVEELRLLLAEVLPVRGGAFALSGEDPLVREGDDGELEVQLVLTRDEPDAPAAQPVWLVALSRSAREPSTPLSPYLHAWATQTAAILAEGLEDRIESPDQLLDEGIFQLMQSLPLDRFEEALRERSAWLLPEPPAAPLPPSSFPETSPEWLQGVLGACFPARSANELVELAFVGASERGDRLIATFQLIVFDDEPRQVRDIKEQELVVLEPAHRRDPERAAAFFAAWSRVLPDLLARVADVETLMPHDFYPRKVLGQRRPRTEDEFVRALARHWKLT